MLWQEGSKLNPLICTWAKETSTRLNKYDKREVAAASEKKKSALHSTAQTHEITEKEEEEVKKKNIL